MFQAVIRTSLNDDSRRCAMCWWVCKEDREAWKTEGQREEGCLAADGSPAERSNARPTALAERQSSAHGIDTIDRNLQQYPPHAPHRYPASKKDNGMVSGETAKKVGIGMVVLVANNP